MSKPNHTTIDLEQLVHVSGGIGGLPPTKQPDQPGKPTPFSPGAPSPDPKTKPPARPFPWGPLPDPFDPKGKPPGFV